MDLKLPVYFEWVGETPRIRDNDGNVVCVISTGTIHGPYNANYIRSIGKAIVDALNKKRMKQDGKKKD